MIAAIKHTLRLWRSELHEMVKPRSPHWETVQRLHLAAHPSCAACGSTSEPQVHHKIPFASNPGLELDMGNLITLCMDVNECHLRIGHGDSFQHWNPDVEKDCEYVIRNPLSLERVARIAKIKRIRITERHS